MMNSQAHFFKQIKVCMLYNQMAKNAQNVTAHVPRCTADVIYGGFIVIY